MRTTLAEESVGDALLICVMRIRARSTPHSRWDPEPPVDFSSEGLCWFDQHAGDSKRRLRQIRMTMAWSACLEAWPGLLYILGRTLQ
jgi:hypothetical protein